MLADVAIMEAAVQVQIVEESKGVQVGGAIRETALQVPKDYWLWVLAKNVKGLHYVCVGCQSSVKCAWLISFALQPSQERMSKAGDHGGE